MTSAKRWLFLLHRWLGIVLCAFFAMWFVSGVVMMYVGYPKLTSAERLQHLPRLDPAQALLGPAQALALAGITGSLKELRLAAASGGQPVYLVIPAQEKAQKTAQEGALKTGHKAAPATAQMTGQKAVPAAGQHRPRPGAGTLVVDARSGALLRQVDAARVLASAAAYAGDSTVKLHARGAITEDAFTHSRALDAHRPLQVVDLDDAAHTRLYLSGKTGEVVRDAPRWERGWNYAGAWIHWLYPFRGNVFDPYWADIVNWLSIVGLVVALSGTVIGILRWRFRRPYKSGARTPYASGMMRWHHLSGLLFAAVTLTWIFSGLMSMNPWRILDSGAPPLRTEAMDGGKLQVLPGQASVQQLLAAAGPEVRELRWVRSAGQDLVLAHGAVGRPQVLDAQLGTEHRVDEAALQAAAARLLSYPLARVERLTDYDLYYYSREAHTMTGGGEKPLPMLRLVFDDPHQTWVHLDPHTGQVLGRMDQLRRVNRWVFAMLHSWDWQPLLSRRPLWDGVLIVLSLGGAVLSLTGVVIGWRRLGRKLRPGSRLPTAVHDGVALPHAHRPVPSPIRSPR